MNRSCYACGKEGHLKKDCTQQKLLTSQRQINLSRKTKIDQTPQRNKSNLTIAMPSVASVSSPDILNQKATPSIFHPDTIAYIPPLPPLTQVGVLGC
jgi:hypothetical protein